jgi:hypothetical protein
MTDADEAVLTQAMSRALRIVADEPGLGVPTPGLAERVVRAHRRRRALLVTGSAAVVAAVVAVTAVVAGGGFGTGRQGVAGGPTSTGVSAELKAAVRDARFVAPVSFDGGALTIVPADSGPHVTEPDALNLFRTTGGGGSTLIRDVVIGYGTATLRSGLGDDAYGLVKHTPVWVVVFSGGPHMCPMLTGPGSRVPEGRHVFLLDRNGTWAVDYRERGSFCGGPATGPTAAVARQFSSLAWTAGSRTGTRLTVRYQSWGCAPLESTQSEGGSAGQQVQLTASGPFMVMSCPAPIPQTTQVQLSSATAPVSHAPVGPIRSYTTDGSGGLQVYDGR